MRVAENRPTTLPPCYPVFNVPASVATFISLYQVFKDMPEFQGLLPDSIEIKINGKLVNARGRAMLRSNGTVAMDFSRLIVMDRKKVVDVLLHEMIHIWQFSSGRRGGHGSDFQALMQRINRAGFAVSLRDGDNTDIESPDTYYMVIINGESGLYSKSSFNPVKVVQAYMANSARRFQSVDWVYYVSKDAATTNLARIPQNGSFPSKGVAIYHRKALDTLAKSPHVKELHSGQEKAPSFGMFGLSAPRQAPQPAPSPSIRTTVPTGVPISLANSMLQKKDIAKGMSLADYTRLALSKVPTYAFTVAHFKGPRLLSAIQSDGRVAAIAAFAKAIWDSQN